MKILNDTGWDSGQTVGRCYTKHCRTIEIDGNLSDSMVETLQSFAFEWSPGWCDRSVRVDRIPTGKHTTKTVIDFVIHNDSSD